VRTDRKKGGLPLAGRRSTFTVVSVSGLTSCRTRRGVISNVWGRLGRGGGAGLPWTISIDCEASVDSEWKISLLSSPALGAGVFLCFGGGAGLRCTMSRGGGDFFLLDGDTGLLRSSSLALGERLGFGTGAALIWITLSVG